jgi:hypothetical protein
MTAVPPGSLGDARLVTRLDGTHRSTQYGEFINASWVPGRTLASLRVGLAREEYDVAAWIENLTGEDMLEQIEPSSSTNLAVRCCSRPAASTRRSAATG